MSFKRWSAAMLTFGIGILCVACTPASEVRHDDGDAIVISDNVAQESYAADNSIVAGDVHQVDLTGLIPDSGFLGFREDDAFFNKDGKLYCLSGGTEPATKLADFEALSISKDGSKALYLAGNALHLYHIEDSSSEVLKAEVSHTDGLFRVFFLDDQGEYVAILEKGDKQIWVVNTTTKTSQTIKTKTNVSNHHITVANNRLYFYTYQGPQELSSIDLKDQQQQVTPVIKLPHKQDIIFNFDVLDGGKRILFTGTYNNDDGIFLYQRNENTITKLVSGGEDEEGRWVPTYNLAPDGSKLLFDTVVKDGKVHASNIYLAQLVENKLTEPVLLLEKAQLGSVIQVGAYWSNDSSHVALIKRILDSQDNLTIEALLVFPILPTQDNIRLLPQEE